MLQITILQRVSRFVFTLHKSHFAEAGRRSRSIFLGFLGVAAWLEDTGESVSQGLSAEPPRSSASKSEVIHHAGINEASISLKSGQDGVFEIGKVRLDKRLNTVSFPAELNMNTGPIEYFLVTGSGKRHESILVTGADPFHIQAALLLLGARGAVAFPKPVPAITALPTTPTLGQESGEPGRKPSAVDLLGDRVRIELTWREGDKEVRRDAEALFLNQESQTGKPQPGKWIYNGSRVENGMFFAQTSGSVISLITDQDALINSGAPGHDNDDVWAVNATNIPPFKTSVMVTILLPKKPETK